jgi:hypothetical protein
VRKKITLWIALLYFIGITISLLPYLKSYINIQNEDMYAVVDFDKEPQASFFEKYHVKYKEKNKDSSYIEYKMVIPRKDVESLKELKGVSVESSSSNSPYQSDQTKLYDLFYKLFVEPVYLVPAILYVIVIIYLLIISIKKLVFKQKKDD